MTRLAGVALTVGLLAPMLGCGDRTPPRLHAVEISEPSTSGRMADTSQAALSGSQLRHTALPEGYFSRRMDQVDGMTQETQEQ